MTLCISAVSLDSVAWMLVLGNSQNAQQENRSYRNPLCPAQVQTIDDPNGHQKYWHVDNRFRDAASKPVEIIVDAVVRIRVAVDPDIFDRNAVQAVADGS